MDNPQLELLKYRAFPELGRALRARVEQIVGRLSSGVREVLPSADELTFTQLRDHLPAMLDEMATALESTNAAATRHFLTDSREHGVCRYDQSFNLRELLVEYSILRSILIEELSDELSRPLAMDEIMTINVGVDSASRRAATAFVAHMNREIASFAEAQSKYLMFLSHDLRGGLNGILLMIEVLKRELAPSPQFNSSVEDLDLMRRSILETVGTMDRFLHAERFRKGKVEVRLGQVDLHVLFHDLSGHFMHSARAKGLELRVDADAVPTIVSDRELLTMILQNLVGNAVKYSSKGTIEVQAHAVDGGTRLSVSDQGPGILPEKLDRLFAPFVRGDTYGQDGIGLGLSIARQAADLLGARLWAESVVGRGTTFILELPAKIQPAPSDTSGKSV